MSSRFGQEKLLDSINRQITKLDQDIELLSRQKRGQEQGNPSKPSWQGISHKTLKKGDGKNYPRQGDLVSVLYKGTLPNGKVFDSNLNKGRPFQFRVGEGQVIKGWDIVIFHLSLGQTERVTIPSSLAYGEKGAGGGIIPPNSNLTFKMTLLSIN